MTTQLSPHFTIEELNKDGATIPTPYLAHLRELAPVLEAIRAHFGKPLNVTSGYRDYETQDRLYKEAVAKYGSSADEHVAPPGHSQHNFGEAADIWIDGVTPAQIAAFAITLPAVGGVGLYASQGFCHVDIRPRDGGPIARWGT